MKHKYFIKLTVEFEQESDGRWTALCIETDTAQYGDTFEEAHRNIIDAICIHLGTLQDLGELENFLKEKNINVLSEKPPKFFKIDAPINPKKFIHPYLFSEPENQGDSSWSNCQPLLAHS